MNRKEKTNLDSRIDYGVILPVFLLSLIGMLSLYVALYNDPSKPKIGSLLMKQGLWYLVGGLSIVIIMHFSSKLLWRLTPVLCTWISLNGITTEIYDPVLAEQTGSKTGFALVAPHSKPSELMKIAFILMLAYIVTMHNVKYVDRTLKSDFWLIAKMLLVAIPVIVLVLLQKTSGRC